MPAAAKYTKRVGMTVDPETRAHIKELADRAKLSESAYLRMMIAKEFQLEKNDE